MKTLILLCLLSFQPQTTAIVDHNKVEIVLLSEAQNEFSRLSAAASLTEAERSRFAALVAALESTPVIQSLPPNNTREFLDNEIRRGVRKPLQGGDQ